MISKLRKIHSIAAFKLLLVPKTDPQEKAYCEARKVIRKKIYKKLKLKSFSLWTVASKPRMNKAKGVAKLAQGLKRVYMQIAFNKYISEVEYLRELQNKIVEGQQLVNGQVILIYFVMTNINRKFDVCSKSYGSL